MRVTDRWTDGRTDRRTDYRILITIPRMHYIQRGKNETQKQKCKVYVGKTILISAKRIFNAVVIVI